MESKVKDTIKKIDDKERAKSLNRFVEIISKSIENERPLFVSYIFESINNNIEKGIYQINLIIEEITEYISQNFTSRKRNINMYMSQEDLLLHNFSNLSLLKPEFWRENTKEDSKDNRDLKLEKAQGINNHIAYLYVPEEVRRKMKTIFFGVTIGDTEFNFTAIRSDDNKKEELVFKKEQTFDSYSNETFGQLSYIGKRNYEKIFLTRMSTFAACNEIYEQFRIGAVEKASEWSLFEIAIAMSGLISTHHNGLEGSMFKQWISNFVREINNKSYEFKEVGFPEDEYWSLKKETIIPMCTSSISSPWNETLGEYLKTECGYNIGTFYAILGKQKRDFYIEEYGSKEVILVGECKNHESKIEKCEISAIINKLKEFNAKINLIVVKKLNWNMKVTEHSNVYVLNHINSKYEIESISEVCSKDESGYLIIEQDIL